jgi:hypothetical protein
MEQERLPPWDGDPLSTFMANADENLRVTALNWPDVYAVQQEAHRLLAGISEIIESDPANVNLLVPRLLIARSHSAILAAMRNAMSGQAVEAAPALRFAIEATWYALHVAKDPAPPDRAKIWWERGDSEQAIQVCKNEFTVANVRATHEQADPATAGNLKTLYGDTIDYGGHPNQGSVSASLLLDISTPDVSKVKVGILHPGTPITLAALKAAIDVTIGAAKTVGLIYPERFQVIGVNEEINQLVQHSAEVFGKHATNLPTPARCHKRRSLSSPSGRCS